jgi:D-alanyl-D-alanine-carboxypeptidase/D-alanyl-D-alanine-endopeptidase
MERSWLQRRSTSYNRPVERTLEWLPNKKRAEPMRPDRRSFTQGLFAMSLSPAMTVDKDIPDPEADRIHALLVDWVDRRQQFRGVAVGAIEDDTTRWDSHGVIGIADAREVTDETFFNVTSLTPVFTGLLLTDAVLRNELMLADPVRWYLPAGTKLPKYRNREITLLDLALHTTGLPPKIPNDGAPLLQFLSQHELTRPIGESWSHSDLDYELLAIALTHCTGMSYQSLIQKRIAKALMLEHTGTVVAPWRTAEHLARPHLDYQTPVPEGSSPRPIATETLYSTTPELAHFLHHAGPTSRSPLSDAFAAMLKTTCPAPALKGDQAIGWVIDRSRGDARMFCSGTAVGNAAAMMFAPGARRAVVALGNSALAIDGLALEILGS